MIVQSSALISAGRRLDRSARYRQKPALARHRQRRGNVHRQTGSLSPRDAPQGQSGAARIILRAVLQQWPTEIWAAFAA